MNFTLKACLFVVASLFLTTFVSGLPQQDTKDEGSKTEQKKPVTKEPHKGTINPIEHGGTAATTAASEAAAKSASEATDTSGDLYLSAGKKKTAYATKKAAVKTGKATEMAADKTGDATKTAAKGTANGVKKGAKAAGKGVKSAPKKPATL